MQSINESIKEPVREENLAGAALHARLAAALGFELDSDGDRLDLRDSGGVPTPWDPSTIWADGGPLIEKFRIIVIPWKGKWIAWISGQRIDEPRFEGLGDTMLLAACRALAVSPLPK
jgi:Protein of unknown function (DUF2591)